MLIGSVIVYLLVTIAIGLWAAQRAEAILGERAMQEARQLRQRIRPVRRLPAQRAHDAAPADLLTHPALEKGLRRGP